MKNRRAVHRARLTVLLLLAAGICAASDWPQSGCDAQRSNVTTHELPAELQLLWTRTLPVLEPAWLDQPLLQFDAAYHPIIVEGLVIIASPRDDSVAAYDAATGAERWRFFTGGPVRLPPAAAQGRIFAGSDDGFLYALNAKDGKLLWKFKGAPRTRRVLGNKRLIDTWGVRGAPVVSDGKVYFAAGFWPFMGVFLHSLDAATGTPVWSNSGDGSLFITQPHSALAFAGIAPQGMLAVSGEHLIVPNGRACPAVYDLKTGAMRSFNPNQKLGGHEVLAGSDFYIAGGKAINLPDGKVRAAIATGAFVDGPTILALSKGVPAWFDAVELKAPAEKDPAKPTADKAGKPIGKLSFEGATVVIRAGSRVFAAAKGKVAAFAMPLKDGQAPAKEWEIDGTPVEMAAGANHLIVSTTEGKIFCLGAGAAGKEPLALSAPAPKAVSAPVDRAKALLAAAKIDAGYGLVLSAAGAPLARALVQSSKLNVVLLEPDAAQVDALRRELAQEGLYGERLSVVNADLASAALPAYFASLIVAENSDALKDKAEACRAIYRSLHPYHGVAVLDASLKEQAGAIAGENGPAFAASEVRDGLLWLKRSGGVKGGGEWTHQHGNPANTRVANDTRVKAPLGLLWFGGSTHFGVLPRHGHGPMPQVVGGRVYLEGADMIRAMDIYTGRPLWEAKLPEVGKFYDNTAHQPGANAAGSNLVSLPDGIHVAYGQKCVVLDNATGEIKKEIPLPRLLEGPNTIWSFISAPGNYLVGGAATAADPTSRTPDSKHVFVMERATGKMIWSAEARSGFRNNTICVGNGRLYAIDRFTPRKKDDKPPADAKSRLVAFELATGKPVWSSEAEVFGTWMSISEEHDTLVESGTGARDTYFDEAKGMRAYKAKDGTVLWTNKEAVGPGMIRGTMLLQGSGALQLLTGKTYETADPVTGGTRAFKWARTYGCNTPAAGQHLLTFRSGMAGFFNLERMGGTGNIGGIRSGCTNNLIQAGGIICAPDYTRTCTCSYHLQTSIALVNDDETEEWTYMGYDDAVGKIVRIGVNLGAPGDRVDDSGTMWLEFPANPSKSPKLEVVAEPKAPEIFRKHSSAITGERPWITASGARGLSSLTIPLGNDAPRKYTVKLYFVEPDGLKPGQRLIDVTLQGASVLKGLDIAREAGGPDRSLVREFKGIAAAESLVVGLKAANAEQATVLCGVELKLE